MIDTASLLPAVPPPSHAQRLSPRIRVVLTIDFDAVSGWLGTGMACCLQDKTALS
jgi:hypothetical protein